MAYQAENLACKNLAWIGIRPSQIQMPNMTEILIPLSPRDRKKLKLLLERVHGLDLKRELQKMLCMGYKAEIQIFDIDDLVDMIKREFGIF
jgi:DNA topoisomerase VI subunit A